MTSLTSPDRTSLPTPARRDALTELIYNGRYGLAKGWAVPSSLRSALNQPRGSVTTRGRKISAPEPKLLGRARPRTEVVTNPEELGVELGTGEVEDETRMG